MKGKTQKNKVRNKQDKLRINLRNLSCFYVKKWNDFHRFVRQIFLTCVVPYDTLKLYISSFR